MKLIHLTGLLVGLTAGTAVAQGKLTVNVSGLKNAKGLCQVRLFNSADGFPIDNRKAVKCVDVPITGTTSHYVFEQVPAGTYAVVAYHDENGNHTFDRNFMGIPKEAVGTTNGIKGASVDHPDTSRAALSCQRVA